MSYIPLNLGDDIQEQYPVPAGRYDVTITSVEEKEKEGKVQLDVSLAIIGHDKAPNVRHFISLPNEASEPKKAQYMALLLKRFLTTFNIPHTPEGFDMDDFIGASANVELTLDTPDEKRPTEQYNRLQVPRLRDEEAATTKSSKKSPPKR